MRIRAAICTTVAGVVLGGCGTAPIVPPPTKETPDPVKSSSCDNRRVCAVPVTVVVSGLTCSISIPADKEQLVMSGKSIAILWFLTPASILKKYSFDTTKGIVLKAPDPNAQFLTQEPVFNNHAYLWVNQNSVPFTYDYSINIVDEAHPGTTCTKDPKIFNQ